VFGVGSHPSRLGMLILNSESVMSIYVNHVWVYKLLPRRGREWKVQFCMVLVQEFSLGWF